MIQIRGQLTRLKNKVAEKLPDGEDLFGYPGVTKEGVAQYIDRAYHLTERIELLKRQFPLVALKRKIRPHLDICKKYLEEVAATQEAQAKFDDFLSSLTFIHDEIALTHTVFLSETLRSDAELEEVRDKTKQLHADFDKFRPQVDEVIEKLEQITTLHETLVAKGQEVEELADQINETATRTNHAATTATVKAEVITKYESETKNQKQAVIDLAGRLSALEKKLKTLLADSQEHIRKSEENLKKVAELEAINTHQQEVIQQTLKMASKYGMAASFKERKDELHLPMWIWAGVFTLAIISIFFTGAVYVVPQLESINTATVPGVLIKISLIAPLVWLGWVSAKQYGFLSRIREDYSFKYASALAFEGYKKEAVEVNKEMLGGLLAVASDNMALNPLRIYGSENHASPVHEAISSIFKRDQRSDARDSVPLG